MLALIAAFLCGAAFTLFLVLVAALAWFYYQPLEAASKPPTTGFRPFIRPQLPQHLREVYARVNESNETELNKETCNWYNLIADFLFRELRDTPRIKQLVIKKINKEFEEFLTTKTEGKMIEQLIARDYSMGTSLPVIHTAAVENIKCDERNDHVEIDIAIEFEYTGQCEMQIDADLMFNKAANVVIKLQSIKGRGRLRFSKIPHTHYCFAFYEEPKVEMTVESLLEGRKFPQLNSFIESQIRKYIRRRHTLPAFKMRYKPFFEKFKPQNQLLDVHVHGERLIVGELEVEVVECSQLVDIEGGEYVRCTMEISSLPWEPVLYQWRTRWPVHEIDIEKPDNRTIGIKYKSVLHDDNGVRSNLVIVTDVIHPSEAYSKGVKMGDILAKVNNIHVSSVKQTVKLIQKSRKSLSLSIQRPPSHVSRKLLKDGGYKSSRSTQKRRAHSTAGLNPAASVDTSRTSSSSTGQSSRAGIAAASGSGASARSEVDAGLLEEETLPFAQEDLESELGEEPKISQDDLSTLHTRSDHDDADRLSLYGVGGERELTSRRTPQGEDGGLDDGVRRRRRRAQTLEASQQTTSASALLTVPPDEDTVSLSSQGSPGATGDLSASPSPSLNEQQDGSPEGSRGGRQGGTEQSSNRSNKVSKTRKTREVPICKNPVWNKTVKFNVSERHHYLNVCVWSKLQGENVDRLIGYVTISLTDIAMECLCVGAHTHHQRYVLVATGLGRPAASRAMLLASTPHGGTGTSSKGGNKKEKDKEKLFMGEILLRFRYHFASAKEETAEVSREEEGRENTTETSSPPRTGGEDTSRRSNHSFVVVEREGTQKCQICQKKIWNLNSRVFQCQKCNLICHKKCVQYCMKEVPCVGQRVRRSNVSVDHLRQSSDGDFAVYSGSGDEERETSEMRRAPSEHRHLQQRRRSSESEQRRRHHSRSSSFEMVERFVEAVEEEREEEEEAGTARQSPEREEVGRGDEMEIGHEESELLQLYEEKEGGPSSESEVELLTPEGSDIDHDEILKQEKSLQEVSWYGNLPLEERETALKTKVSTLQREIDRINEMINEAQSELLAISETSPTEAERIRNKMADYEDKLHPLKLLMMQLLLELDHCEHPPG